MPRPTPRAAPKARPSRPSPKPRRQARAAAPPAPAAPTAPSPKPQPTTPFATRFGSVFRPCTRVRKAFKQLSVRFSDAEIELFERARRCRALMDSDEPLVRTDAIRRLAMVGAESLGLVSADAAPA